MKRSILFLIIGHISAILCASGDVQICSKCNGAGYVRGLGFSKYTCSVCKGKGKITTNVTNGSLTKSSTSNKSENIKKICSMCNGCGKFRAPNSIMVSTCSFCKGRGVSLDERYNTTVKVYVCIDCGGRGTSVWDGTSCTNCLGTGYTYSSLEQQINSSPSSSKGSLCGACGGSTRCPVCKGYGGSRYGDVKYCKSCGNTGKCKWCHGRGY